MNAEEARKITETSVHGTVYQQTESIKKVILEAANKGELYVWLNYNPHTLVVESLKKEGYEIYSNFSRNETNFKIS